MIVLASDATLAIYAEMDSGITGHRGHVARWDSEGCPPEQSSAVLFERRYDRTVIDIGV
jgi:hypothetical protein